ncbi:MAG: SAM-dependent methyltransferase [Lachnospiraceae bacterium]|nr:SAM-dependent methyltransferase [Lachnospiraceae bacterium]
MEELKKLLNEQLNKDFGSATLSGAKDRTGVTKVRVRPIMKQGELLFQLESFRGNQAFHENLSAEETCEKLLAYMQSMKQMQMETRTYNYTILVSKKGKVTIKRKLQRGEWKQVDLTHNRKKHYILEEGKEVPFLRDLGVMTAEGKIVHSKFDKFRQINRFLEFVEDVLPELPKDREVTILDFGCGKSYLTFAMYYYLHELHNYDVRMIGLDLKSDVIRHCNELSEKYGYKKLKFLEGNIADYTGASEVDMVVTLHACDTATDFALEKAVGWNAKVILSVPCCQHELNRQIACETLKPVLKYGLLKERFAALLTDGLRAEYLESVGYDVQILEFIDMEHTPKNLLIRAVKSGKDPKNKDDIRKCEEFLHVHSTLGTLLEGI